MNSLGISLAVQWLGVHAPIRAVWVQSLVGKLRSCILHGMAKKEKIKLYMSSSKEYKKGDVKTKIPSLFVQTTWNLNFCS